jgi:hypothetical protein
MVTVSGLPSPTLGRLAFRYFVENGGPGGTNSDYIGIDTVQYDCNGSLSPTPTPSTTPAVVARISLPIANIDVTVNNFTLPVQTSAINSADNLVGFQGDFLFDATVITFGTPQVQAGGLTSVNWNVSASILNTGPGSNQTLRISAFSNDFTPLSGSGTLFNLNMVRISNAPGASTDLTWAIPPANFIFIDGDLNGHAPGIAVNGNVTLSGQGRVFGRTTSISGNIYYCSNPLAQPVTSVTLTATGPLCGATVTNSSGNYQFSSLPLGGDYIVTPSRSALLPGSSGIDTIDVIATQRHFLGLGTPLSGCRLTAANVNGDGTINTVDVIAIQRFYLGLITGVAKTGKYQFVPATRIYTSITTDEVDQNYGALIFGDVTSPFVQ